MNLARTTVATVDSNSLFADCLGVVLEMRNYDHQRVPVPTGNGQTNRVGARLLALRPDVALINPDLGTGCNGTALVSAASRAGVAVVALVDRVDERRWGHYLSSGARIVVPKSESLSLMVSMIRRLSHGQRVLDHQERDRLIELSHQHGSELVNARARLERLSTQEAVTLRHLMAGRTVREIAPDRAVSEGTVRSQVKGILAKLEVSSQLSAVALAHIAGWRPEPMLADH